MIKKILYLITFMGLFFASCSSDKKYKEYKINDLSKPIFDTLTFVKDGRIIGLEVLVIGNVKGKAVLEFENGSGRFNRINLENQVNQVYETEWYSPKLAFKYLPEKNIKGDSLIIKYRMY